jgi:crotonobetainyl-CoA:carnitine CoA-transferase CaiB-like acyl-CoA transferase
VVCKLGLPPGPGCTVPLRGEGPSAVYGAALLGDLGLESRLEPGATPHPAALWAGSGAMALTGSRAGPPSPQPWQVAVAAHGAGLALAAVSGAPALAALDTPALLGERAAVLGLQRRGRISAGGSCRLLRAADGWLALSLPRADDRALLPAWLGQEPRTALEPDPWPWVEAAVDGRSAGELVERARLLGLAAAPAAPRPPTRCPWVRVVPCGKAVERAPGAPLRVVDLSALWAGPLCAHLLGLAGAQVVKVESGARPDGARAGPPAFFDLLHAGKRSVALDLRGARAREELRRLLRGADVVVESSRPRALEQLGIDAEQLVAETPGLTWLSLTGYGRPAPAGQWIAFGDDAAAAAGLAWACAEPDRGPRLCADAVADPLAGLHAALAALVAFGAGGGCLLDVALCGVAAQALARVPTRELALEVRARGGGWELLAGSTLFSVAPPRARPLAGRAAPLGAHSAQVLAGC